MAKMDATIVSKSPRDLQILLPDGSDLCKKVGISNIDIHVDNDGNKARFEVDYVALDMVTQGTCYVTLAGKQVEIKGFIDMDGNRILL